VLRNKSLFTTHVAPRSALTLAPFLCNYQMLVAGLKITKIQLSLTAYRGTRQWKLPCSTLAMFACNLPDSNESGSWLRHL